MLLETRGTMRPIPPKAKAGVAVRQTPTRRKALQRESGEFASLRRVSWEREPGQDPTLEGSSCPIPHTNPQPQCHVLIPLLPAVRMPGRSEEHTSELQSRGLISYAVF